MAGPVDFLASRSLFRLRASAALVARHAKRRLQCGADVDSARSFVPPIDPMAMAPKTSPNPATAVSAPANPWVPHMSRPMRPDSRKHALSDLDFDTFDYAHLEVFVGSLPSAVPDASSVQFGNGLKRKRALSGDDDEDGAICMKKAAEWTSSSFTCTFCPQCFGSLPELRAHTMSSHGDALRAMLRLHAHGDDRETQVRKLTRLAQILQMDVRGSAEQRRQAEGILSMLAQEQRTARMPPRKRFRFCASVPEEEGAKADEEQPCELLASVERSQSPVACSIKKEPVSFEDSPQEEEVRPSTHYLPIRAAPAPMRCSIALNRTPVDIVRPPPVIPLSKPASSSPPPQDKPKPASLRVESESPEERASKLKTTPPPAKFFKSADRKSKDKLASGSVADSVISRSIKSAIASVTLSERDRIKKRKSKKELAQRPTRVNAVPAPKPAAKAVEKHVPRLTPPKPTVAPVQCEKKEAKKSKEDRSSSKKNCSASAPAQCDRPSDKEKLRESRRNAEKPVPVAQNDRPRRERRAKSPSPSRSECAEHTESTESTVETVSVVELEVEMSTTCVELELDPDSIFMCSLCEMTFYCMEAYDEHLLQQHGHFTCHKCDAGFGSWLAYDTHWSSRHAEASDPDIWGYFDQFLRTARDTHKTYSVSDYIPSFTT